MALSADGEAVLVGDRLPASPTSRMIGIIHVLNGNTGERQITLHTAAGAPITQIAVSPKDGIVIATSPTDRDQPLDIAKRQLIELPQYVYVGSGPAHGQGSVFSKDGSWHTRFLWNVGSGRWSKFHLRNRKLDKLVSWEERDRRFQQAAFSADGKLLAAVGFETKDGFQSALIVIWDTP
jgi:hypothetical protein